MPVAFKKETMKQHHSYIGRKIRSLLIIAMVHCIHANAQTYPIVVQTNTVQPIPPYLPQIKADLEGQHFGQLNQDITSHLSITLMNTGNTQLHIKLYGSIERVAPSPMGVKLRPDFVPSQPIVISPHQMTMVNQQMLQNAFGNFNENSLIYDNLNLSTLRQTGVNFKLPEGTYRICVTAYDYDKPGFTAPLSAPGTGCAYFTICYTASAPQFILPVSTLLQSNSSFQPFTPHSPQIQFSWTPPATTCGLPLGALTYDLEIRQVFPGQTVTDAINNPFVFRQQYIPTTTFLLDTLKYSHILVAGQQYIMRVKANFTPTPGSPLEIANQGYSQIGAIAYQPGQPTYTTTAWASAGDTLPSHKTKVKGRLSYRFDNDTSGLVFPVSHEWIYLEKVYAKVTIDPKDSITSYLPLSPEEQSTLPIYPQMFQGLTTQTDKAGNFELTYNMTTLDSSGILPDTKWNMLAATTWQDTLEIYHQQTGNPPGNISPALKGQVACLYKVITANPHYKPSTEYLEILPGSVKDVTDLVLDANSYTLNVNVRKAFNNQSGNYVQGAQIKIYRLTANKRNPNLEIPLYEGSLLDSARDWKETGDKVLIAQGVTPDNVSDSTGEKQNTVSFPRLFKNTGSQADDYIVYLEKGGVLISSSLPVSPVQAINSKNWTLFFDEADALFSKRTDLNTPPYASTDPGPVQSTDSWTDWNYKGQNDTATLSLKKELVAAPHSQVTGTLQYAYKGDGSTPARPYANMPVSLEVVYLVKKNNTPPPQNNSSSSGNTASPVAYYQGVIGRYANMDLVTKGDAGNGGDSKDYMLTPPSANPKTLTATHTTTDDFEPMPGNASIYENGQFLQGSDNGKVLQTVTTDAQGHFTFDFENIDSTMQIYPGGAYTGSGDLRQQTDGQVMRVYRVVPQIGYYCAPDDNIPAQPWSNYDCGTLTSFVHTYNLVVHVVNNNGDAFGNIPIHIYRSQYNAYAMQRPEKPGADINTPADPFQQPVYGNSTAGSPGTGSSKNMFMTAYNPVINSMTGSSYLLKRSQETDNTGTTLFTGMPVSLDAGADDILIQADAEATVRQGAITFQTANLIYPKNGYTQDYYTNLRKTVQGFWEDQTLPNAIYNTSSANYVPVLFNKDLDPTKKADAYLLAKLAPPRIAGRVIDKFSTLGIPNIAVYVRADDAGDVWGNFWASTDNNGYFDVKEYSQFYSDTITHPAIGSTLIISAPGYKTYTLKISRLPYGTQSYTDPIPLEPLGANSFGYVADAQDTTKAVTARVKLKINGRWVDTYSYSGDADKANEQSPYAGLYAQMIDQGIKTAAINSPTTQNTSASGNNAAAPQKSAITNSPRAQRNYTFGGLNVTTDNNGNVSQLTRNNTTTTPAGYLDNYITAVNNAQKNSSTNSPYTHPVAIKPVAHTYEKYNAQRFDIDLPAAPDSIIIMPYDPAYITQTFAVSPKGAGQNLGTFGLKRRVHKIMVHVTLGEGGVNGAIVSIDGITDTRSIDTTGKDGNAYFEFINNSTHNFTLRVRPQSTAGSNPALPVFVSRSENFSSDDDGNTTYINEIVDPGEIITGQVTFAENNQPVKNAFVYLDQGVGSNSDISAISASDGSYRLIGVPGATTFNSSDNSKDSFTVKATFSAPGETYIGDSKKVIVANEKQPVNLVIQTFKDLDASHIYGFDTRLEKLQKNNDGTYTADGEIYNIPANENFSMQTAVHPQAAISFHSLRLKPSGTRNQAGIPVAIPVNDSILLDSRNITVNLFKVFNSELTGQDGSNLSVAKGNTDTSGTLAATAHVVDNSFNFPTSYMTISDADFYLGNYGPASANKLFVPVFTSDGSTYKCTKFSLTDKNANGIHFKYLGFDGTTGNSGSRESFIMGDSVNLFLDISTTLEGNIPLQFHAGKAVLTHNSLSSLVNNDSASFALEKWKVQSGNWELSPQSGGIMLKDGVLRTGLVDLPFTKMFIISGDPYASLSCNSLTGDALIRAAQNGLLTIGGGASKLRLYPSPNVVFVYDPDVGTVPGLGHYKFSLSSNTGNVAWFGGMDGMTNPTQRFNIQFLSQLSDGEQLFSFDPNRKPITFYNQIQFTPNNLFSLDDRLQISGSVDLGIPHLPTNINGNFTFYKVNSDKLHTNKLTIDPFSFSVSGDGGTQFKTNGPQQLNNPYGIGISGDMTVPGVPTPIKSMLVSMVYSGANQLVGASGDAAPSLLYIQQNIKQQAEVLAGDALNQAQDFADGAQDYVKGAVNDARNTIVNGLNQARSTLQQAIPLGDQQIAGIAAKWRLAGEGMDAIKDFSNNPAGSLARLNGVLDGFTGIDAQQAATDKLKMVANEALSGAKQSIPVDNISNAADGLGSTFQGMKFDFDLPNKRITGSLTMNDLNFGAVVLQHPSVEMLMDPQGWYFYAGLGVDLPTSPIIHPLIFPLSAGMIVGSYPVISPSLESRVTQNSYVHKLPKTYAQGIHGFFFTGRKDIIPETSFGFDFTVVDFEVAASAGFDARLYANFGDQSQQIGLGAMAFGNVYAKVTSGLCQISGNVDVEEGIKMTATNSRNGMTFSGRACASATVGVSATCGVGPAATSGSVSVDFLAWLSLCTGNACEKKGIDFGLQKGGGNCSGNNDFDY